MSEKDFPAIFDRLRAMLVTYAPTLNATDDLAGIYSLETDYSEKWKKPLFFGSVVVRKNYVSFYLMPVYMYPDLLEEISPALKKHMQGKSCFNFKQVDEALLAELDKLVNRGFTRFQQEGLILPR
jgi:hypothetical protein